MDTASVIAHLQQQSSAQYLAGMARFGIDSSKAIGVRVPELRKLARAVKKNHELAMQLWETGLHEARLLATMIADPQQLTTQQMDKWVHEFYSWDICDQACGNLFVYAPFVLDKLSEYTQSTHEFVKRTGFVLMAEYAVHQKKVTDDVLLNMLPIIEGGADDDRNFVKKAVSWALRQIGKRNAFLKQIAIATAERIKTQPGRAAKWVATDVLKELQGR